MSVSESDIEIGAKKDMEAFLRDNPEPDCQSAEYVAWNQKRIAMARAYIDAQALKFSSEFMD